MTAADAAEKIGMPLHLVRSGLREMVAAGLVREDGERFGQTEKGAATVRSSGR
jgi:predicted transcriptional regulator